MNTPISLGLLAVIALFFGIDALFFGWDGSIFLGRKLTELIEWMAFWR